MKQRHPWIFSGAVHTLPDTAPGDIIAVCSLGGEQLALGFFDPQSQIVCRLFEWQVLDILPDVSYWTARLNRAIAIRKAHFNSLSTNAYRLINAEGDALPGLIVDVYLDTVVAHYTIPGMWQLRSIWEECLIAVGFQNMYYETHDGQKGWAFKEYHGELIIKENNLKFLVSPEHGQKTGFFIDQRENRQLLRDFVKDKKVLNAFSYSGAFSVYALAAQAALVHSVDVSDAATAACEQNVELNFGRASNHKAFTQDCFEFLRRMSERYDVIILDPPAFAKSKAAVDRAARGYKDINLCAAKAIGNDGILFTFSCSQHISADLFQKIVFGALLDAGREASILYRLQQPLDHPVSMYHPEGTYLKGLVLQVK